MTKLQKLHRHGRIKQYLKAFCYYVFMTAFFLTFLASICSSVYVAKIIKENNTEIKTVQEQLVDINARINVKG